MSKVFDFHEENPDVQEWQSYLSVLPTVDNFVLDASRIFDDLQRLSPHLFGKRFEVLVSDTIQDFSKKYGSQHIRSTLKDASNLDQLFERRDLKLRIISLMRLRLHANFRIDRSSLLRILRHHKISPSFIDFMIGFRDLSSPAEKGYGIASVDLSREQQQVISYALRYMEPSRAPHGQKWTEQRLGVYHVVNHGSTTGSFVILLHAHLECKLQQSLHEKSAFDSDVQDTFAQRPLALHAWIFSSYLHNWRWYLDDIAHDCRTIEARCLTMELNSIARLISFADIRHIRNIESQLVTAATVLKATASTLRELLSVATEQVVSTNHKPEPCKHGESGLSRDESILKDLLRRCEAYILSAEEVQKRNEKLIQLATDSFVLANQNTAERINQTVRIVTIITLCYLPTQFVATFFGSNFILFDATTGLIQASKDTWIFVVVAVPLTACTLLIWWLVARAKLLKLDRQKQAVGLMVGDGKEV